MSTETQHRTTAQVANRLVELVLEGKVVEAQQELFTDDVTCIEPAFTGAPALVGKAAAIEKTHHFMADVEQFHSSEITGPAVSGNWFSIGWTIDVTIKGKGRQKMEEIIVYNVKDGKIGSEQYFF